MAFHETPSTLREYRNDAPEHVAEMITAPEFPLFVLPSPPKAQTPFPLKSPSPLPASGISNAQSRLSAWVSPTPIRSTVDTEPTGKDPVEDVRVPTLLHSPFLQAEPPVFRRLEPMHPCTMDSSVRRE